MNTAKTYELDYKIGWQEEFPVTVNNGKAVKIIEEAARELNLTVHQQTIPFPWSEDFGHFTEAFTGAMFGLGAGEKQPPLHHPKYDFPDEIIVTGILMFERILQNILASKE
ncbi:M20/M25/M40 family metallo-hydrolase [bacterium]|nr:M20/M25/M40 family metallo-hydrolase [bacterium]